MLSPILSILSTPQQTPQFTFNKTPTNTNYCNSSPRKFQPLTNVNKSPSINNNSITILKPNSSPFKSNHNNNNTNNIAIVKMNKENHAVDLSVNNSINPSPNKRKSTAEHGSNSLVKNIKAKFESGMAQNDKTSETVLMTPKSIIKKFEALSRDGVMPLNGSVMPASTSSSSIQQPHNQNQQPLRVSSSKTNIPTPPPPPPPFQVNLKKINVSNKLMADSNPTVNEISSDHINPKSIIERFEQLTKINNTNTNTNSNTNKQPVAIEFQVQTGSILANSTAHNNNNNNSTSLTYISSLASSNRESAANCSDIESSNKDNLDGNHELNISKNDAIYEELGIIKTKNKDTMSTSLFEQSMVNNNNKEEEEDEDEQTSPTLTQVNSHETYSVSSSYTGSIINQEFEDMIVNDTAEFTQDFTEEIEEENYTTEQETEETEDDDGEEDEHEEETTCTYEEEYQEINNINSKPPASSTITITTTSNSVQIDQEMPLFSIKEYRKQKKYTAAGGIGTAPRRSSILTVPMQQLINKNRSKSKLITSLNNKLAESTAEDQSKQAKYLERTKELEELIKQEDNVIHQTGIALERCLTDSHFTGSSEHIECNRILLISCQKRQAYLTEINRVRQLISQLIKRPVVSSTDKSKDADSNEINPADLTGLLIFSDLQLPLKESYLNKVKSGDEKRLFYFLCLIRNGIQVLQTQVISVQELIATRDTYITFPNRMAISNVDVNFKVKIDVYALEMLPKETKPSKPASTATSKFFSPFKHSVFHSHHGSSSSSSSHNNINHHYNEQTNMVTAAGSKTSNFIHIDTIEITNKDLSSNRFKLNISSSSIPLTGILLVNVRCMPSKSIELKGFMTLFEDSNGLRSWDRRWCFLNNYNISYWKYPEDEYKNSPIGIINLTRCLNDKVTILPRDLCARKFTIELLSDSEETDSSGSIQQKR